MSTRVAARAVIGTMMGMVVTGAQAQQEQIHDRAPLRACVGFTPVDGDDKNAVTRNIMNWLKAVYQNDVKAVEDCLVNTDMAPNQREHDIMMFRAAHEMLEKACADPDHAPAPMDSILKAYPLWICASRGE
jgi:hypothetical protein